MLSSAYGDLISPATESPQPKKLKYSVRPVRAQRLATAAMAPEPGRAMKCNNSYRVNHSSELSEQHMKACFPKLRGKNSNRKQTTDALNS